MLALSLDGAPLAKSTRVLVQVGNLARPDGWTTEPETFPVDDGKRTLQGEKIVSTGRMPWMIEKTRISLSLANAQLTSATSLDVNGRPSGKVELKKDGHGVQLDLPPDALYVVIEGETVRDKPVASARAAAAQ